MLKRLSILSSIFSFLNLCVSSARINRPSPFQKLLSQLITPLYCLLLVCTSPSPPTILLFWVLSLQVPVSPGLWFWPFPHYTGSVSETDEATAWGAICTLTSQINLYLPARQFFWDPTTCLYYLLEIITWVSDDSSNLALRPVPITPLHTFLPCSLYWGGAPPPARDSQLGT